MRFIYPVIFTPAEEGGYVVTCRDLPEVITQGETMGDAREQASDAMDEAFASRMNDGITIPTPSIPLEEEILIAPSPEMAIKAALYITMRQAGITELERCLGMDEKAVRRLLKPGHVSRLPKVVAAVTALGKQMVIDVDV